jgi:putative addiction module component (TIGR02574 family)
MSAAVGAAAAVEQVKSGLGSGGIMSIKEIEAEIKKLSLQDRAALAKWLVESLDQLSAAEIDALWAEEAERRLDELEQGRVAEIPAEDVLRRARTAIS